MRWQMRLFISALISFVLTLGAVFAQIAISAPEFVFWGRAAWQYSIPLALLFMGMFVLGITIFAFLSDVRQWTQAETKRCSVSFLVSAAMIGLGLIANGWWPGIELKNINILGLVWLWLLWAGMAFHGGLKNWFRQNEQMPYGQGETKC